MVALGGRPRPRLGVSIPLLCSAQCSFFSVSSFSCFKLLQPADEPGKDPASPQGARRWDLGRVCKNNGV